MTNPINIATEYINARLPVPKTPYTQQQSDERYSSEAEDGNNDEYSRKKREEEEEPVPTREEYESNQREAEREIEYNSRQRELDNLDDDIDQSEPYDDDTDEFSGAYFARPDEDEPKETLGDRIRTKYESLRASASDTAQSLSSTFGASFGVAAESASSKYSRFKRGDPIFSVQSPVRRGKSPYARSISRPGRSISRPYSGGRFGDDFTLGTNGNTNPYYPVNEGRQSASPRPTMDMYLPNGEGLYNGELSAKNDFKRSKYGNQNDYDPFGFGKRLAGDGFKNTEKFGTSLMGFESDLFGGGAGNDTVFGSIGKTGKMNILGDSGMFAIGDLVSPPASRKTTTKRKSTSTRKTAKKSSKKTATKRKSARKATIRGFALP